MNGEPQDSTTSSRPIVEGLRSNSDHITTSQLGNAYVDPRALQRREHSDGELSRHRMSSGSTRSTYNPLPTPHNRHQRYPGPQQFVIPPRTDSLGPNHEHARDEARHRAALMMLRHRREQDDIVEAARRRASSMAALQSPAGMPRRHAASLSMNPIYRRPEVETPSGNTGSPSYQTHASFLSVANQPNASVVPRWQPDAEVTNCPICTHAFSFFYRKHHCRKCGRVVCANCSPHRITLPRQYIVNPPALHPIEIDLTGDTSQADETTGRLAADQIYPMLGGGEEVRLCNPCVPDPHPLPPPPPPYSNTLPTFGQPSPLRRNPSDSYSSVRRRSQQTPVDYARYHGPQSNPLVGRRSSHQVQSDPLNIGTTVPYGSAPDSASMYGPRHTNPRPHRHHASLSVLPSFRQRAVFEAMTSSESPPPPAAEQSVPQIAEEDECPICHEELPAKGLDGNEMDREAHIATCIEGHFLSSRPKHSSLPASITAAIPAEGGSGVLSSSIAGPSVRRRTTGMVVYQATEKDCIGSDGTTQECIICFEDFEPGTDMGRLECLCKFHKVCIRSWWDTKGVGACPVHQGGLIQ